MGSTVSARRAVFLGPVEISGYYQNLERGLRELEVPARLVTLYPSPFGYGQGQPNPWPAAWAHRIVLRHRVAPAPLRLALAVVFALASVLLLLWTLPRFHTYIFAWGTTLLPRGADLPLLRLLRKRVIVVVGHGSEARPPYMATMSAGAKAEDPGELAAVQRQTRSVAGRLRRLEHWADVVVGLPTTAQFLRRPFVDFYALGIPTPEPEPEQVPPSGSRGDGGVTVVHIPSKPEVKGSAIIRACMEQIMHDRPEVGYVEITGRPHGEVLEALATADLVVDQLWSDIPMAVVGTEAAALGTPTVIAGYAWDVWERLLPAEDWPPTVRCAPDDLRAAIESCLDDLPDTARLGENARRFVVDRWSCRSVAERYLRLVDGNADSSWLVDPRDVDYGWGCGIAREDVERVVHALVSRSGWQVLAWPRARQVYEQVPA